MRMRGGCARRPCGLRPESARCRAFSGIVVCVRLRRPCPAAVGAGIFPNPRAENRNDSTVWQLSPSLARSIVRILVLAAVVSGCREDRAIAPSTPNSSPTEPLHSVSDSRRPPTYLPYGVPVPDTEVLVAEPEPYDRNRHGPTLKDTRPGDNLAARPGVELPRVKLGPGFRGMTGPSFASAEVSPSTSGHNDS